MVSGQKRSLENETEVAAQVKQELDAFFSSPNFLNYKDKKYPDVKGSFVVEVSVSDNGKVVTFFKVSSEIQSADFLNDISNSILHHRFNFRLPKKQRQKVRYTYTF